MSNKKRLANDMIESVGRVQQSLGITPNKQQAELMNKELQTFIESYLQFRDIEEVKEDGDESLVIRY